MLISIGGGFSIASIVLNSVLLVIVVTIVIVLVARVGG